MSTSILYTKPEEIDSTEKRGKIKVSVIGCGHNGVLHACLFAEAGFEVTCVDSNRALIKRLARGRAPFLKREIEPLLKKHVRRGRLKATKDVETAVKQSEIIVITTPAGTDKKRNASYLDIEKVCKQTGSNLQKGSLVILASTVGPGVTEDLIRETLENASGFRVGVHFGLAYSPIKALNEQTLAKLADCRRIVAAVDKRSLNAASAVLKTIIGSDVFETNNVKTLEAAKLFESVQHCTNIALANEFACFCEKAGIDYLEARRLAGEGGYCILASPTPLFRETHEDPCLLLEEAENLDVKLRVPAIARETNEDVLKHMISLIREALKSCGKTLRRAKISIVGISQTPNIEDVPKASTRKLAKLLEKKGARVSVYDPHFSTKMLTEIGYHAKKSLADAVEGTDCIAVLTGHRRFEHLSFRKLRVIANMPAAIVDFEGVVNPEEAEMEGFIYRGFGRGVWTK